MRVQRVLITAALAASAAVVVAPVASSAASTVDVSITNGPPGTRIVVDVADCGADTDDSFQYLNTRLVVGTAPNERLAGVGYSRDGALPFTIVVPDWVDPDQPAVIESSCTSVDFSDEGEPDVGMVDYEPVPFDVEPGGGAPTQTRTFSRTSLRAGQGFVVSGVGCDLPDAQFAATQVAAGGDLSGRSPGEFVADGFGELDGGAFEAETLLSNSGFGYSTFQTNDGPVMIDDVEEFPTDIAPGTYTAVSYCASEDELLVYEPEAVEVTGAAPTGAIELTATKGSDQVILSGTEAPGPVDIEVAATSAESLGGEYDGDIDGLGEEIATDLRSRAGHGVFSPLGLLLPHQGAPSRTRDSRASGPLAGSRVLPSDDFIATTVEPDADGSWSYDDTVAFDYGIVEAYAVVGDPFADGFVYDPQVVVIDTRVAPPARPPVEPVAPVTPAAPAPAPANAVPGRPNFTG